MAKTETALDEAGQIEARIRAHQKMVEVELVLEKERSEKRKIQKPIKEKIDQAKTDAKPEPIVELVTETSEAATIVKNRIKDRINDKKNKAAAAVKVDDPFKGPLDEDGSDRYLATQTEAVVCNVIDTYKRTPDLITVPADTPSRHLLNEFLKNVINAAVINEHTAPYVYTLLRGAIDNKITNPLKDTLDEDDLNDLYLIDKTLYKKVIDSIQKAAELSKISDDEIHEFVAKDETRRNPPDREKKKGAQRHTTEEANKLAELEGFMSKIFEVLKDVPGELVSVKSAVRDYTSTFLEDPKVMVAFRAFATRDLPEVITDPNTHELKVKSHDYGLGLSPAQFEEYVKLYKKVLPDIISDEETMQSLELYGIKAEDFKALSGLYIDSQLRLVDEENITQKYFSRSANGAVFLTDYGKREMAHAVYVTVNKLLGKITSTMNVEWRSLYDPWYEGKVQRVIEATLFKSYQSVEITNTIKKVVGLKTASTYLADNSVTEYIEYVRGLRSQYQNEISTRQNYFDLRNHIIKGTATPEQMAGFAKNFPAHTKEALFKGESGFLFQLALSEFQCDLQTRIAMSGNQIPADIFGSYFDENGEMKTPDLRRVRDRLWQKIERLKILIQSGDPHITKLIESDPLIKIRYESLLNTQLWEIERALILAPGFSMVDSMRSLEIVAQGARRTDFKGLFNFAQYITIIGKWRIARGRQEDNSGGFEIGELFDIAIRTNKEEKPLMERIMERGWVPREVYERSEPGKRKNIDKLIHQFDNMINDLRQQEGDAFEKKFEDAFRDFALLGFYSRTGWRIAGFKKWYGEQEEAIKKDIEKKDISDSQKSKEKEDVGTVQFKYKYIREQVGAAACWFYDTERAGDDVKAYLLQRILGPDYKTRYDANQLGQIFNAYHEGHEKEKKVVQAQGPHGHVEAMTVEEFIEEKRLVYKGMNFKALMERSPYDFMLIMNQLEPKLNQLVSQGSNKYSCYEYYFTDAVPKNQAEELGKLKFIQSLKTKWSDENMDHIKRVAKIWHDTYSSGLFYKKGYINDEGVTINSNHRPGDAIDNVDTDKAQSAMYDVMTFALTQVKVRHKGRMTGDDFLVIDDSETDLKANKDFIQQSKFFRELFIGDAGLLAHFDKEAEKFGDKKGEELSLGSQGFFARWSKVWEMQMGKNMFASTNDLLEGFIFEKIDEAGPDVFVRLWGDLNGWNKAVDTLITLDHKLLDAGEEHKLDKIYAIHKEIKTLEGMVGKRGAQKHNRQIAFLVARYFQTDWRTRLPAPFNKLAGDWYLGSDVSLSTLHGEVTSMKMNSGAIHDYLHHMVTEGYIDEEDMEIILENVGADLKKFMAVTGGPSFLILGAAFIIGAILVKTIKEVTSGKK